MSDMKKWAVVVATVLTLAGSGLGPTVLACGEKFLVPGRSSVFQRTPADRGLSNVLVFASAGSELARTLDQLKVEASIRKAGYRPTVVTSVDALDKAADAQGWDVIMIDLADGPVVRNLAAGATLPMLLPVVQKASGVQLSQARSQFSMVLKSPSRNQDFLDALDDAVAAVRADQAKVSRKAR